MKTKLNTCTCHLLTVKFKYARPVAGGPMDDVGVADLMHIVLRSAHMFQIHDTGARVFDMIK